MTQDLKPFSTSHTDLATYLIALGGKVVGIDPDPDDPKTKVFTFELTPEQVADIPHFADGTRHLSALVMTNARHTAFRLLKGNVPKNV